MKRPQLMAIINLTPDSFSGDGMSADAAIAAASAAAAAGADILDIGAESTRPGATPLSAGEEYARLYPFLAAWQSVQAAQAPMLSVDTRHAASAALALQCGANIINDQSGLTSEAMATQLAPARCDIVVMHSLTIPASHETMWPEGIDPVAEIMSWKKTVTRRATEAGIAPERLIFDPGIGFGKRPLQSLALILRAGELCASGGRWLFGHSRKSYLSLITDVPAAARDDVTLAFSASLAQAGAHYLRVHAVEKHRRLLDGLCTITRQ